MLEARARRATYVRTHCEPVVLQDVHLAHRARAMLQQPRIDAVLVEFVAANIHFNRDIIKTTKISIEKTKKRKVVVYACLQGNIRRTSGTR